MPPPLLTRPRVKPEMQRRHIAVRLHNESILENTGRRRSIKRTRESPSSSSNYSPLSSEDVQSEDVQIRRRRRRSNKNKRQRHESPEYVEKTLLDFEFDSLKRANYSEGEANLILQQELSNNNSLKSELELLKKQLSNGIKFNDSLKQPKPQPQLPQQPSMWRNLAIRGLDTFVTAAIPMALSRYINGFGVKKNKRSYKSSRPNRGTQDRSERIRGEQNRSGVQIRSGTISRRLEGTLRQIARHRDENRNLINEINTYRQLLNDVVDSNNILARNNDIHINNTINNTGGGGGGLGSLATGVLGAAGGWVANSAIRRLGDATRNVISSFYPITTQGGPTLPTVVLNPHYETIQNPVVPGTTRVENLLSTDVPTIVRVPAVVPTVVQEPVQLVPTTPAMFRPQAPMPGAPYRPHTPAIFRTQVPMPGPSYRTDPTQDAINAIIRNQGNSLNEELGRGAIGAIGRRTSSRLAGISGTRYQ